VQSKPWSSRIHCKWVCFLAGYTMDWHLFDFPCSASLPFYQSVGLVTKSWTIILAIFNRRNHYLWIQWGRQTTRMFSSLLQFMALLMGPGIFSLGDIQVTTEYSYTSYIRYYWMLNSASISWSFFKNLHIGKVSGLEMGTLRYTSVCLSVGQSKIIWHILGVWSLVEL
jgi:hypothetical protein